jgi:hypothetical protein
VYAIVVLVVCTVTAVAETILLFLPDVDQPPPPPAQRRRGVFVGIDYTGMGRLDLEGLGSQIMGDFWREAVNLGYFAESDARLLVQTANQPNTPSHKNVLAALKWLLADCRDGDVLYFHYLGHGGRDTRPPTPYEYLITLDDSLKNRDVLTEAELQSLFASLSPKVNLTCVFHCCFSGDMIDHSDRGRGIALASSVVTDPTTLRRQGANFTGAIGTKMKSVKSRGLPMPTYVGMRDFINGQPVKNDAIVVANALLYDVNRLIFIDALRS